MRALELIEEKGGGALGQNDFRNALQSAESATALELLEKRNAASKAKQNSADRGATAGSCDAASIDAKDSETTTGAEEDGEAATAKPTPRQGVGMDSVLDLNLIKTDIDRVYPIIYYTLKGLLSEWADTLSQRPDTVKHTMQGKLAAATQVQSADYLKPLFKKLRKRSLPPMC